VRLARHNLALGILVGSALMLFASLEIMLNTFSHYAFLFFIGFFAVLAAALNAPLAGAPLVPTLRIFSPDPAAIRFFFAAMLEYNPGLAIIIILLEVVDRQMVKRHKLLHHQ